MTTIIKIISDDRTGRITARTVNLVGMAAEAAAKAAETNQPVMIARHGGSVCNSYGYPADTEGAVVVAIPHDGAVVVACYATQLAANKVTLSGVAATAVGNFARPLWDARHNSEAKNAAKSKLICRAMIDAGICS